jgi:hypothetical protein
VQLEKYLKLSQRGNIIAEYVWIDAVGGIRSKSRVRNLFSFTFARFLFLRLSLQASCDKARHTRHPSTRITMFLRF